MMRYLDKLMFGLMLLLVGAIVLLWSFGQSKWLPPKPIAVDTELLSAGASGETQALAYDRAAVFARPVFMADRRPIPLESGQEAPVAEAVVADQLAAANLLGVVGSQSDGLIILQTEGVSRRLATGEKLGAWTLTEVNEGAATFVDDAGTERVLTIKQLPAESAILGASNIPESLLAERRAQGLLSSRD